MSENYSWEGWETVARLGAGSYGEVYKIQRRGIDGHIFTSALKVISIPREDDSIYYGNNTGKTDRYVKGLINELIHEISLMDELKSNSHIVRYEDHKVIPHQSGIGYDLLIRMECLTPLKEYSQFHPLDEQEIIKIGLDIGDALQACHCKNIIHRDIKPGNVMRDESGNYKLGDFGIARTMDEGIDEFTRAGTMNYIAPEVIMGKYDSRADIYSLGMLLYYYLNEERFPFENSGIPTPMEKEAARSRRFSGEMIPPPKNGSQALHAVILKALEYNPEKRYSSPSEFLRDLGQCDYTNQDETVTTHINPQPSSPPIIDDPPGNVGNGIFYAVIVGTLLLIGIVAFLMLRSFFSSDNENNSSGIENQLVIPEATTEQEETQQATTEEERQSESQSVTTEAVTEEESKAEEQKEIPAVLKDATEYEGHYYKIINTSCTWKQAQIICEEEGGHLATITSQNEQDFIRKLIEKKGKMKHYWLGGTDKDKEGTWKWVTGEPWSYTNWEEEQPNNSTREDPEHGQDYLEIQATRGDNGDEEYMTWTDIINDGTSLGNEEAPEYNSTKYYGLICEWNSQDVDN